jgi:TonB family protein
VSGSQTIVPGFDANGDVYPELTSGRRGGESCRAAAYPKQLPGAEAIFDSTLLRQALTNRVDSAAEALVAVRFAALGLPDRVVVLETTASDEQREIIEAAVRSALRQQKPAGVWGLRLYVRMGPQMIVSLERSRFCPATPVITSGTMSVVLLNGADAADVGRAGSYRVRVLVSWLGEVIETEMAQSSGSPVQDRLVLEAMRKTQYKPARLDGSPIATWREWRSTTRP